MRICYFTHNLKHDNGAGVFSSRLCEEMQTHGVEVVAFSAVSSRKDYERSLLSGGLYSVLFNFRTMRRLCKDADSIHALDAYPYAIYAYVVSFGLHKPLLITAVGTGSIAGLYIFPRSLLMTWIYRRASRVIAISSFTKQEILKKIPRLSIDVIGHGVDYERFAIQMTSPLPTPIRSPYILSVGSLRARKGYKYSIAAFALLADEFPNLSYVIVGKRYHDVEYTKIKERIAALGLQDRVHILDTVDDDHVLCALYQQASVFCLLSQHTSHDVEGFGLVFLEAAAVGLPAVGTTQSGITDAMQEGVTGFLVEAHDVARCADALRSLLTDRSVRQSMVDASRVFARAHSWESKCAQYRTLYRSLSV
jgi:glycosyltransferase involved in cell wall biosynthesis